MKPGHPASTAIREANDAYLSLLRGGGDRISRFFSEKYTVHLTELKLTGGPDLVRSVAARFKSAFSDLTVDIEVLVESGDRITWQRIFRGTQTGAFHGFPASGREVIWRDMITSRFENGLIAEEWVVSDLAERLLLSRNQS